MATGAAVVGFGLRGIFLHLRTPRVVNLSLFLGAAGIAHDFVWAPALVAAGLATRLVPTRARRTVRAALACSVSLVLFSIPLLAGPSTKVRNPTVLPLDYGRNLVLVLAALWIGVAASIAKSYWSARPRRRR